MRTTRLVFNMALTLAIATIAFLCATATAEPAPDANGTRKDPDIVIRLGK
ncbi:hypothetical protein WN55_11555 [Dufourea novaeangliae]|uniref:Uncharacterized protein n=1 Tax=Dufourea novaeangliae TaxID=178035 RepID=A0A154PB64_DUFNO|nr:hypothetical protein WN55_11555 [Dufourea novaeangliae]